MSDLPPPPDATNQLARHGQPGAGLMGGLMLPLEWLNQISEVYTRNRGIIHGAARIMHQKIPPELDRFMQDVADGNSEGAMQEARRAMAEQGYTNEGGEGYPQGYGEDGVPFDRPGEPVMTDKMAEQAYFMHMVKKPPMGTLEIAQWFTQHGSPVSKATVARYIEDKKIEYESLEEERRLSIGRRVRVGMSLAGLWLLSSVGLHYLLNFLHLL